MPHSTSRWSLRWFHHRLVGIVGTLRGWRNLSTLCQGAHEMTIMILAWLGFEPTTVRTKSTSQRTRPLGHTPASGKIFFIAKIFCFCSRCFYLSSLYRALVNTTCAWLLDAAFWNRIMRIESTAQHAWYIIIYLTLMLKKTVVEPVIGHISHSNVLLSCRCTTNTHSF